MRNYLILVLLSVIIGGCAESPSTSTGDTIQDLYAYKVGNEWTYRSQWFNEDGSVRADDTSTMKIEGVTTFRGHEGFITRPDGRGLVYFEGTTDAFGVVDPTTNPGVKHTLHYPLASGDTYILADTVDYDGNVIKQFLNFQGNNVSLTTGAGTFACKHFKWTGLLGKASMFDTVISYLYFAPGVGLVKEEDSTFQKNGNKYLSSIFTLIAYKVTWP